MNKKSADQIVKICFISLNSYHLLTEKNPSYAGGAEVQQIKIATELKKRGHEIFFIIYGENNNDVQVKKIGGFNILPAYNRNQVDNLSFLHKTLCIWRKMKEVDADIYYHRTGSTGITTLFCRLNKKKIINHISSDAEVTGEHNIHNNILFSLLNKIGKWVDIKLSDKVISQNNFQKSKLHDRFKVDSIIIKNSVDTSLNFYKKSIDNYLLWIGTIRSIKQPELFLKIAQYFPEYKFVMIGGEGESSELFKKIKNDAEKIQNVEFKGFVSPEKIFSYYQKAILLINTSKIEGFPNVFLEAWVNSIPVVSLNVDPDEIILKHKLGFHSKTFNKMVEDVKILLKNDKLREEMGINSRKYVLEEHDIIKIAGKYEELFKTLIKNID
jgi:glycosyltransferase involved in cell wall biosynthesis